jgi:hypothetical protein
MKTRGLAQYASKVACVGGESAIRVPASRLVVPATLVAAVALLGLAGCGGGGDGGTSVRPSGRTGTAVLTIQFPPPAARAMPTSTKSVLITVTGEGLVDPFTKAVDRPATQTEVRVALLLPVGAKTLTVDAKDQANGQGSTVATGTVDAMIADAQTAAVSLELAPPYPAISGFAPGVVKVGDTLTITGRNFDPDPARNVIGFYSYGSVEIPALTATRTRLTVKIPELSFGSYTLGVAVTGGAGDRVDGLHVVKVLALDRVEWEIHDLMVRPKQYGPTFSMTNGTPDSDYYYTATATCTVPPTVTLGQPNGRMETNLTVAFDAKSAVWDLSPTAIQDYWAYVGGGNDPLPKVVQPVQHGGSYTLGIAAVFTPGNDGVAGTAAYTASPAFSGGGTARTYTNSSDRTMWACHYLWTVHGGQPNRVVEVTAYYQ